MSASGSGAGRWLLLVLMLGGSGWASFTLYERTTRASAPDGPAPDPRLEQLVTDAFKHLAADDLELAHDEFMQGAGIAETDARVQEGLVLVAVRGAERKWLEQRVGGRDATSGQRLEAVDNAVHAAREVMAEARRKTTDAFALERIGMAEQRLNTLLVLAFVRAGEIDRARGVLGARLASHPQRALLERWIGAAAAPAGSSSAAASVAATTPPAPRVPTPPPGGWGSGYEPHYELDHEPTMQGKPKTPNELEVPPPAPPTPPDLE